MRKCYAIVEKTEYLSKNYNYDPVVKVLCVHSNHESAVEHFKKMQRQRSNDVEWNVFGDSFSYVLPNTQVYGTDIFPREDAKITISLKSTDFIAD